MKVIPALDILDGKAVQLRGGDPLHPLWEGDDPVAEARRWWDAGAEILHVVDLGRVLKHGPNPEIVQSVLDEAPGPVHVGGGLRGARQIRDILEPHPEAKVVVATRAWRDANWLDHITDEWPGRIIVALELKHGTIAVRGWTERTKLTLEEGLFRLAEQDLGGVLVTDIDREGQMRGPNVGTTRTAVEALDVPVIASGGISTVDHVRELREAGAWGCVIGTALYTGDLAFEDVLEVAV